MIHASQVSVVMQGPIPQGGAALAELQQRVARIRKILPGCTLILSTCNAQASLSVSGFDQILYSVDPGALPAYKLGPCKPNNVNRQIVSAAAGLAQVRTPFALKLRVDAALVHRGCVDAWDELQGLSRNSQQRILTGSWFSLNPRLFERLAFHFSDVFQFGRTESLQRLWSAPLMSPEQASHYLRHQHAAQANLLERRYRSQWAAEQHVWRSYAQSLGYAVPQSLTDTSSRVLVSHDDFLAHELIVLDAAASGVQLPALEWVRGSGLQRFNCLNHLDWLAAAAPQLEYGFSARQSKSMRRRRQVQSLLAQVLPKVQPAFLVLARPPLKRLCSWALKAADRWSRPHAPESEMAFSPFASLPPTPSNP